MTSEQAAVFDGSQNQHPDGFAGILAATVRRQLTIWFTNTFAMAAEFSLRKNQGMTFSTANIITTFIFPFPTPIGFFT